MAHQLQLHRALHVDDLQLERIMSTQWVQTETSDHKFFDQFLFEFIAIFFRLKIEDILRIFREVRGYSLRGGAGKVHGLSRAPWVLMAPPICSRLQNISVQLLPGVPLAQIKGTSKVSF
jgi:hypothetical protein